MQHPSFLNSQIILSMFENTLLSIIFYAFFCWTFKKMTEYFISGGRDNAENKNSQYERAFDVSIKSSELSEFNVDQKRIREKFWKTIAFSSKDNDKINYYTVIVYYSILNFCVIFTIAGPIFYSLKHMNIVGENMADYIVIFNQMINAVFAVTMLIILYYLLLNFLFQFPKTELLRSGAQFRGMGSKYTCVKCDSKFSMEFWETDYNFLSATPRSQRDATNYRRNSGPNQEWEQWVKIRESSWTEIRYSIKVKENCCVCEHYEERTIVRTKNENHKGNSYERRA